MEVNEVALKLMLMVEEGYTLDDAITDYKKALAAVGGSITIGSSNVLGKTGGRSVPIVKHQDIKTILTESISAHAGTAVTSNLVKF